MKKPGQERPGFFFPTQKTSCRLPAAIPTAALPRFMGGTTIVVP
jgi:hypothetical protein